MDLKSYIDEIKLQLTGNLLELEIPDETLVKVVYAAFREIQRYIDLTVYETIPYSSCINLNPRKVNAVSQVYRAQALISNGSENGQVEPYQVSQQDPMGLAMWQGLTGMYGYSPNTITNYSYRYMAYSTANQIRNTLGTDLAFRYDRSTNNLYINVTMGAPNYITIKYIPRFDDPSEIYSDYWIDILMRMSVAMAKVILGRIRSRFTQSNALWTMDGDTMLNEGNAELTQLRAELKESTQLFYPVD